MAVWRCAFRVLRHPVARDSPSTVQTRTLHLKENGTEFIGKELGKPAAELAGGDAAVPVGVERRILPGDPLGGQLPRLQHIVVFLADGRREKTGHIEIAERMATRGVRAEKTFDVVELIQGAHFPQRLAAGSESCGGGRHELNQST